MSTDGEGRHGNKPEIVKMFRESVKPYSQGLVALHPHLYGSGLYHRASELKALDKIIGQLNIVVRDAKSHNYKNLPPLLEAIKDALNGKPKLSWWNLVTISWGQAISDTNEEADNAEEKEYLTQITNSLTEIIRGFNSPDTKLLLNIRLTALEVDSRLVELEKIPHNVHEPDETLDYLASEFQLLINELDHITGTPNSWKRDTASLQNYVSKSNQLMRIVENVAETNPPSYQRFIQLAHLKDLYERMGALLHESVLISDSSDLSLWQPSQVDSLFELFSHFPGIILQANITDICTLLKQAETQFVKDPNLNKTPPVIFSSMPLKHYITARNAEFAAANDNLRAVIRGLKQDRTVTQNIVAYLKKRIMDENDLHHICAIVRYKSRDFQEHPDLKEPPQIQKETLARMNTLVNLSQPRDLDNVLKSFTEEEKENRYYLSQEVILEQFIRWRKQGIY